MKYIVQNPRNIPEGIPVVTIGDVQYMAGDTVTAKPEAVESLVERGYLKDAKEVSRGEE